MKINVRFYSDDASRLIWSIIGKRYGCLGIDLEDLYAAGYIGYLVGAKTVGKEITKDTISYLYTCIIHEITRALHKEIEYKQHVHKGQELYENTVATFVSGGKTLEEDVGADLLIEGIAKHLHRLNKKEQYIINNFYLYNSEGRTLKDIGEMWGVTRQHASKIGIEALEKLAAFMSR